MSIKDILDALIPPADASDEVIVRWRYTMGSVTSLIILCIICLYLTTAKASDLNEVKAAVYIPTIQQLHEKRCITKDIELRRFLAISVNEYQQKYFEATGDKFPLESCKVIQERLGV